MITVQDIADRYGDPFGVSCDEEWGKFMTLHYPFGMITLFTNGEVMLESQFIALGEQEMVPALDKYVEAYEGLRSLTEAYRS